MIFTFGSCVLDDARYELRREHEVVHVEPQVFDVLLYLVRHRDRVVTKDELLSEIWGGPFVGEAALTSRIKVARRAIGDDGTEQRYIRTVRGRGFQFASPVEVDQPNAAAADALDAASAALDQQIRFCRSPDGVRIAYAELGHGPPLVKAANWMTHLGFDIDSPVWRHWLDGLSREHRLIRYDERGCGLSDWDIPAFSFESWVQDLELVVDAVGAERFPLLGISQGGAVAVDYAVRHPQRVRGLVLVSAYALGRAGRATTDEERRAAALDVELARVGWGRDDPAFRQVFAAQFLPRSAKEDWEAFDELQRRTTSPANAVRFLETFAAIDVRDACREVKCPTLIVHARDDHRVPLSAALALASLIPQSRLVTLSSCNHLLDRREAAWPVFLDELHRFLAEI